MTPLPDLAGPAACWGRGVIVMTEGPSSATHPPKKYQCSQLEAGTRGQEVKPRRNKSRKPGPAPNDPLTTHSAVLGPQEGDLLKGIKARKPVDQRKLIKDPKEPEARPESGDTTRPGPQALGRRTTGRWGLNEGTDSSVRTSCTPVLPQSHQPAPPEHGAAFQKYCRVSATTPGASGPGADDTGLPRCPRPATAPSAGKRLLHTV